MPSISKTVFSRTAGLIVAVLFGSPSISHAEPGLVLGLDGVGTIAASGLDLRALRANHRQFQWEQSDRMTESGLQRTVIAHRGSAPVLTVVDGGAGRISHIEIVDPQVGNWLGPRIGDPYHALHRNLQLGACEPGMEHLSGQVLCKAAETPRVTYAFSGQWNGPDGKLPPATVLENWTMSKMVWNARSDATPSQPVTSSPSFDCADTFGSVEEMICEDPALMALDRRLNDLYAHKIENIDPDEALPIRAFQRGWIKARNDCFKASDPHQCVVDIYNDRIAELQASLPHQFEGTSWRVVRVAGDKVPTSIDVNVTFGGDGNLNGTSGCNRYFAPYGIVAEELRIGQIGGTKKLCADPKMIAERRFLDALEQVNGWAARGADLVLYGTGAELTLRRQ